MYSRKQFFHVTAVKCFDLIKDFNSIFSFQKKESSSELAELIPESLFLEAICLGIDPATMNPEQLSVAVNRLRDDTNNN